MIFAASWPKDNRKGNDTTQLFLSKKAIDYKRKSIVDILSGKAKGDGRFAQFAVTLNKVWEPVCRHFTLH